MLGGWLLLIDDLGCQIGDTFGDDTGNSVGMMLDTFLEASAILHRVCSILSDILLLYLGNAWPV